MKALFLNLSILALLITSIGCNSVNGKEEKTEAVNTSNETVEVYYFHNTRRCATCTAVENVTVAALEKYYSDELKDESLTFKSIDLEESGSKEFAEKLEISGQTLLVVSGDKKENLTTDAFMNARNNPEKLKEIIKSTIDPLLSK